MSLLDVVFWKYPNASEPVEVKKRKRTADLQEFGITWNLRTVTLSTYTQKDPNTEATSVVPGRKEEVGKRTTDSLCVCCGAACT